MVTPIATGILFDSIIPSEDRTQLATMIAALIVAATCKALFSIVQSLGQLRMEGRMAYIVQSRGVGPSAQFAGDVLSPIYCR